MRVSTSVRVAIGLLLVGCSEAQSSAEPGSPVPPAGSAGAAGTSIEGHSGELQLPALEAGFRRFVAPPIEMMPGTSGNWMQWVGGPTDQDYDVAAIRGAQSGVGHHAIIYTTTEANPVGFTRVWSETDQLTTRTMGGVGAEGAIPIPDGVVVRIKKGSHIAIQTHYFNPSEQLRLGQTYIDVKLAPPNPDNVLASSFTNTSLAITLPGRQQTVLDVSCKIETDLRVLRATNHMHEYGVRVSTEITDPAGKAQMIKADDTWSEHWSLAPNYAHYSVHQPLVLPAGSTIVTRCTWNNTTDAPITFPDEMCAFSTLVLGSNDIRCINGVFQVSSDTPITL